MRWLLGWYRRGRELCRDKHNDPKPVTFFIGRFIITKPKEGNSNE